ncbi:MAG TPA: hypothetical protein VE998_05435, partial [Terriglobales bacterium]|nr:hypothetical protein [Terriglobales bacterium]
MAKAFQYGMYAISGVAFTSALVAALPVVGAAGTIAGMAVSVPSLCGRIICRRSRYRQIPGLPA